MDRAENERDTFRSTQIQRQTREKRRQQAEAADRAQEQTELGQIEEEINEWIDGNEVDSVAAEDDELPDNEKIAEEDDLENEPDKQDDLAVPASQSLALRQKALEASLHQTGELSAAMPKAEDDEDRAAESAE